MFHKSAYPNLEIHGLPMLAELQKTLTKCDVNAQIHSSQYKSVLETMLHEMVGCLQEIILFWYCVNPSGPVHVHVWDLPSSL